MAPSTSFSLVQKPHLGLAVVVMATSVFARKLFGPLAGCLSQARRAALSANWT
jgi:hypothetical protein